MPHPKRDVELPKLARVCANGEIVCAISGKNALSQRVVACESFRMGMSSGWRFKAQETFADSALADLRREAPQLPLRAKRVTPTLPMSVRRLNGEVGRLTLTGPGDDPSAGDDPLILAQIDTGLGRPQKALRRLGTAERLCERWSDLMRGKLRCAAALLALLGWDGCIGGQSGSDAAFAPTPCLPSEVPQPFDANTPLGTPHMLYDELGAAFLQRNEGAPQLVLAWNGLGLDPAPVTWELLDHGEGMYQPPDAGGCRQRVGARIGFRLNGQDPLEFAAQFEGIVWNDGSSITLQGEMSEEDFAESTLAALLRNEAPNLVLDNRRLVLRLQASGSRFDRGSVYGALYLGSPGGLQVLGQFY